MRLQNTEQEMLLPQAGSSRKHLPNPKVFQSSTNKKGEIKYLEVSVCSCCVTRCKLESLDLGQRCCSPLCVLEQGSDQALHLSCRKFLCQGPLAICPPGWETGRALCHQPAQKWHLRQASKDLCQQLILTLSSGKGKGKFLLFL